MRKHAAMASILALLGVAGTLWDLAGLRIIRPPVFATRPIQLDSTPMLAHDLRAAYGWADRHLPPGAVLQHDPAHSMRSLEFGLYGRHWPAVADGQAFLFGASRRAVADRIKILAPIFDRRLSPREIAIRAGRARVDYLLFNQRDPLWRREGGPRALPCIYRSPLTCIAAVPKEGRS